MLARLRHALGAASPLAGLLCAIALLSSACGGGPGPSRALPPHLEATRDVHGVPLRIETRGVDAARTEEVAELAAEAARAMGKRVLLDVDQSEIGVLNLVPSHVFIEFSPDADRVLRLAIGIADDSDGAYDPTAGPLRNLWGLDGGEPHVPRAFEIDAMLRRVDYLDIEFPEEGGHSARRLSRRTEIDLGAVASGAVVDAALAALREAGVPAAAVHRAGLHAVYGGTEDAPWRIALFAGTGEGATLWLAEGGVAELRPAEEHPMEDGFVVHGIFDPRDGRPAQHCAVSAAISESAADAGGTATALFVLGEEGPAWLSDFPGRRGVTRSRADERWSSEGVRILWSGE